MWSPTSDKRAGAAAEPQATEKDCENNRECVNGSAEEKRQQSRPDDFSPQSGQPGDGNGEVYPSHSPDPYSAGSRGRIDCFIRATLSGLPGAHRQNEA